MAYVIPENLPRGMARETVKVFRALKKLPDHYTVRLSENLFRPDKQTADMPDFLVLCDGGEAYLIQVQQTRQHTVESVLRHEDFFASHSPDQFGVESRGVLNGFLRGQDLSEEEKRKIVRLILFPNVDDHSVQAVVKLKSPETEVYYYHGLEMLARPGEDDPLQELAAESLNADSQERLLAKFDPTVVLPGEMSLARLPTSGAQATFTRYLLGIDQENFIKKHLELSTDGEDLIAGSLSNQSGDDKLHAWLVTGVSGSGKSIILVYKASLLAEANPKARILLMTHNKALKVDLDLRLRALTGRRLKNVECLTFSQWAVRHLPERITIAKSWKLDQELQALIDAVGLPAGLSRKAFESELAMMKDFGLVRRQDYVEQATSRSNGPIDSAVAHDVYEFAWKYQELLQQKKLVSWQDVFLRFMERAEAGELDFPAYDAILVDEAQFYAKIWFQVVKHALRPGGQLILAADPTQGFLRHGTSWISAGVEVRGRTHKLTKSYRNSREILTYARQFYLKRLQADEAMGHDENVPTLDELNQCQHRGEPPAVELVARGQLIVRAANEVRALIDGGIQTNCLLLLTPDFGLMQAFRHDMETRFGSGACVRADEKVTSEHRKAWVHTCLLDAATGLEAPVVILCGVEKIFDREGDPRLSRSERERLVRENSKRFYMACTRAAQRLLILTENPKVFQLLNEP